MQARGPMGNVTPANTFPSTLHVFFRMLNMVRLGFSPPELLIGCAYFFKTVLAASAITTLETSL